MAGLLDQLLWQAQGSGFPAVDAAPDEAAMAQAAREVAAERLKKNRGWQIPSFAGPDETSPAVQFALGGQPNGGSPLPFGLMGPQAAAQPTMPAPDVPAPMAGPIPLPQPRPQMPPAGDEADGSQLPPNATAAIGTGTPNGAPLPIAPVSPVAAPVAAPAAPEGPNFFSKAWSGIEKNAPLLLALGAGFAGAPSIGQGISRASGNAAPIAQKRQDEAAKLALTDKTQKTTFSALRDSGVPAGLAMAALSNPEIMKSVTTNYLGDRKSEIKTVKDALGNERLVSINPYDNTAKDISGAGQPPAAAIAAASEPSYDPATRRDEGFLQTLDPQTAATVKNIADGKSSGAGRSLQKYMPYVMRYEEGFDQSRYNERNKFHTEMGSTSPNSAGGQAVLIPTAMGHLAEVAEHMADLNNTNGGGSADVGHAMNWVANRTTNNSAKATALADAAAKLSGEVGKIYSGSTGGGVHEREETRARLGSNLTAQEQIAALQTSKELLTSKIDALNERAKTVLGPNANVDFVGESGRNAIARIDKSIARLQGGAGDAPTASAPVSVTTKSSYDALPKGTPYIAPDGSHRVKQ